MSFKNNCFCAFWVKLCILKVELNNIEIKINMEPLCGSIMKSGLQVDGDQVFFFKK